MGITGLGTLQIPCPDLAAAKGFYTEILGMTAAPAGPGKAAVLLGDGMIVLYPSNDPATEGGITLSLACDDVDATVTACRQAGVTITQEPTDQPWGTREACVIDPNGFTLYLQQ